MLGAAPLRDAVDALPGREKGKSGPRRLGS